MWSKLIGPVLAHIHPKLNVRTVDDVGTCWRSRSGRACIVSGGLRPGGLGSPIGADGGPGGRQASGRWALSYQPHLQRHWREGCRTLADECVYGQ